MVSNPVELPTNPSLESSLASSVPKVSRSLELIELPTHPSLATSLAVASSSGSTIHESVWKAGIFTRPSTRYCFSFSIWCAGQCSSKTKSGDLKDLAGGLFGARRPSAVEGQDGAGGRSFASVFSKGGGGNGTGDFDTGDFFGGGGGTDAAFKEVLRGEFVADFFDGDVLGEGGTEPLLTFEAVPTTLWSRPPAVFFGTEVFGVFCFEPTALPFGTSKTYPGKGFGCRFRQDPGVVQGMEGNVPRLVKLFLSTACSLLL